MSQSTLARTLTLDPDRLLPSDPSTRRLARELYESISDLPIISPHGHVPAGWLADDTPFSDPTSLLISPDHYLTRLLHASGVPLEALGVGRTELSEDESRHAFRLLCSHWKVFRGTSVQVWLEAQLTQVFDVSLVPSERTADEIYDHIQQRLGEPSFRPRALYRRFNIEFLATTDDPCDDLRYHRALASDPAWAGRVAPTFRPDRYLEPARPDWPSLVANLGAVADVDTAVYGGWVEAMQRRRQYFAEHGATSSDHSHRDAAAAPLDPRQAARLYRSALAGTITDGDATALRRDFMFQMARMAADDGMVMTLHPAVHRNHHPEALRRFGPDVGADIPVPAHFVDELQPVLGAFGTNPRFQLVLFTIDETTYSRELAPLAGFYPSVYVGAPWWFLDAPDAMDRYRRAVTETAGFTRTSGFIDDTRAYLSIPARHDTARRADSGYLARLVAEHRLSLDDAAEVARDLVVENPRRAFRL